MACSRPQRSCWWCSARSLPPERRRVGPGPYPGRLLISGRAASAQVASCESLNLLPVVFSGPGLTSLSGLGNSIVIASSGNVLIVPDVVPDFTVALVSVQGEKVGSGISPAPAPAAPAIHSALAFGQAAPPHGWVVAKLLPAVVESVTEIL